MSPFSLKSTCINFNIILLLCDSAHRHEHSSVKHRVVEGVVLATEADNLGSVSKGTTSSSLAVEASVLKASIHVS